jgi:predicted secreted hydrolase
MLKYGTIEGMGFMVSGVTRRMAEDSHITTSKARKNSKLGKIFLSFVDTIEGFYDPSILSLIKQVASSSPSPTDVEVAIGLLGAWTATGLTLPKPIPPAAALHFPADHGEHLDVPIEWHFVTLSLNLECGGRISAVLIFFRKAISTHASSPNGTTDLDRQIFSTSLGITVEMPGTPAIHHAFPVVTRAPVEGGVKYGNNPFHLIVGKNSIHGSVDIFPFRLHVEGPGDSLIGRPEIKIDLYCSATNPLFLQGSNGYVGAPGGPSWYYYSWANQSTTGSVTIDGQKHVVTSGLTWMDHQWGGWDVPTSPTKPGGSGWCWFEFQFSGDRALTLACPHNGKIVPSLPGFGVYVEGRSSMLVGATLNVSKFAKSPETDANYPLAWHFLVQSTTVELDVIVTTVCDQQSLWQGGLTEYAEAACVVVGTGYVDGKLVTMEGVGYCESVGLEDYVEGETRRKAWLRSSLQGDNVD